MISNVYFLSYHIFITLEIHSISIAETEIRRVENLDFHSLVSCFPTDAMPIFQLLKYSGAECVQCIWYNLFPARRFYLPTVRKHKQQDFISTTLLQRISVTINFSDNQLAIKATLIYPHCAYSQFPKAAMHNLHRHPIFLQIFLFIVAMRILKLLCELKHSSFYKKHTHR
jgi:hypothetical protein